MTMLVLIVHALGAVLWPSPPLVARLMVESANIRARPDAYAPVIGLLQSGDEVRVSGCVPTCETRDAWAWIEGEGAVRAALLTPTNKDQPAPPIHYRYGRVRGGGARVVASPNANARLIEHRRGGIDLAFLDEDELLARGWLARPSRGFVRVSEIRLATASTFEGERDPQLPLAFVIRDEGEARRYDRARVIDEQGSRVRLETTALSRGVVRIARPRSLPAGLPLDAAWVHVSLREQVLVAYEGTRAVYATLVSTGLAEHPTPRGLFRVWHKERHAPMHGDPPEPYFVDEVPFVQYFKKGIALHGTFWHDRFGGRASHGCVNLSMGDAEWLFDWAPPALPTGWRAIEPEAAKRASLWVLVEP
jgi:hypothetical protein